MKRFLIFSEFSARLIAAKLGVVELIWPFFALRDVLEARIILPSEGGEQQASAGADTSRVSSTSNELSGSGMVGTFPSDSYNPHPALLPKTIEILSAIQWIHWAGSALYRARNEDVPEHWRRALGKKTALWSGEPGFSDGRWKFWKQRMEWIMAQHEFGKMVREQLMVKLNVIGMQEARDDWASWA